MNVAAWENLWRSAVTLFAHEPIQFRVGAVLAVVFLALMVAEGLRASFVPRRNQAEPPRAIKKPSHQVVPPASEPPQVAASTKVFALPLGNATPHAYEPARKPAQYNRKREPAGPRAQRNILPKIRRMVTDGTRESLSG